MPNEKTWIPGSNWEFYRKVLDNSSGFIRSDVITMYQQKSRNQTANYDREVPNWVKHKRPL